MRLKSSVAELKEIAKDLRVDILTMLNIAKSGHPGGSLSVIDILVALFFNVMDIDPKNPSWLKRDKFHLSKGHACPALYSVLARLDYFPQDELNNLREFGSILQGHPHPKAPGIEVASGSLGQGLSIACGMALANKSDNRDADVFVALGDGELQEGQIWESAMFAAHYKLDNLNVIIDNNGLQIDGKNDDIISLSPLKDKWMAFGFDVFECDGHDMQALVDVLSLMKNKDGGMPKLLIADTVKGKGVSFMEHNVGFHGKTPTNEELEKAIVEIRGA